MFECDYNVLDVKKHLDKNVDDALCDELGKVMGKDLVLEDLHLQCPYSDECQQHITLNELFNNVQPKRLIPVSTRFSSKQSHLLHCSLRQVKCSHCGGHMTLGAFFDHKAEIEAQQLSQAVNNYGHQLTQNHVSAMSALAGITNALPKPAANTELSETNQLDANTAPAKTAPAKTAPAKTAPDEAAQEEDECENIAENEGKTCGNRFRS